MPIPSKALVCVAALWLGTAACAQDTPPTIESLRAEAEYLQARLDRVRVEIACTEHFQRTYPSEAAYALAWLTPHESDVERMADRRQWAIKMLRKGYVSGSHIADPVETSIAFRVARDKPFQEIRAAYLKARALEREKEGAFNKTRPSPKPSPGSR